MFVDIKGLSFKYSNSKKLTIDNFSISINKGEIIAILGESGSGKSTVLRLICGLESPIKGTIKINNQIISNDNTFIMPEKRGVGMVFQDYALFPHMTVAQNIKFGLKNTNKNEKKRKLKEVLSLVNLEQYEERYPYELSGGQQQRVALARALAPEPKLMLLDEPFSNLDANLRFKIREELKCIIKRTGTTSIFVTHDIEDAKSIADKVVLIEEGIVVKYGATSQILKN